MTTRQTPDAVREAYRQGQADMRERAAQVCDQRGAEEQEAFGLVRGTQNYFRARNAIRDLEIAALDSRAGDAIQTDEDGEAMVCTGCGTTRTLAAIKARAPQALSCCPERKMVPARSLWATSNKEVYAALQSQEDAEDARSTCECEGEGQWEHCGPCSLRFGHAIDLRRTILFATRTPLPNSAGDPAGQARTRALTVLRKAVGGNMTAAIKSVPISKAIDAMVAFAATPAPAVDAVPADVFPATIGRVHLGERRSDGERLCSHGHPVPAGHPLYWPEQLSQYDDSDPLCLAHAIDQLESDNADWGDDYDAVDAVPAGEVERFARIRTSMALLQQNSEGCAQNHYGDDATLHGMPGWLIDTKADLDAFTDILARREAGRG